MTKRPHGLLYELFGRGFLRLAMWLLSYPRLLELFSEFAEVDITAKSCFRSIGDHGEEMFAFLW